MALAACGELESAARLTSVVSRLKGVGDSDRFSPQYPRIVEELKNSLGNAAFKQLAEIGATLTTKELLNIGEIHLQARAGKSDPA